MSAITERHVATRTKPALMVGAVAAIVAFAAGPLLFSPSSELPAPAGMQLPLFVGLAATEAVVFGAGVAFAVFGRGVVARLLSTPGRVTAAHMALTWALVSWWPHDGLHMVNGTNINGLLAIEYGFHVTLIVAAAVLVWTLANEARDRRP